MNKTVTHLWIIAFGSLLLTTLPKLDIRFQKEVWRSDIIKKIIKKSLGSTRIYGNSDIATPVQIPMPDTFNGISSTKISTGS